MKEYLRYISDFMQVVRRTGSVEYGLRSSKRYAGSARLIIASNGLDRDEAKALEEALGGARTVLLRLNEVTPAELGRAAGRGHPVKALAVLSLGDADLDRFLESVREFEGSGALSVVRPSRRR